MPAPLQQHETFAAALTRLGRPADWLDGPMLLLTRRFPLEQINEAFDLLKSGTVARSILDINPE